MTSESDVAIVGAGLSGLRLAALLHATGVSTTVFEARQRVGGRILSLESGGAHFDMGPAWFWPGQPRMAALLAELELVSFEQFSEGDGTYEDASGRVMRGAGFASMAGSRRVDGGMAAIVHRLMRRLPDGTTLLGQRVLGVTQLEDGVEVEIDGAPSHRAKVVVLSLPPRVAAELRTTPDLPAVREAMRRIPTWMGGQAKVVALYDRPWWREAGLSGDAISQRGPLAEIHDASPRQGGPYALFGFVGRRDREPERLFADTKSQLARVFGARAEEPIDLLLHDWAADPETATEADRSPLRAHPSYGLPSALRGLWEDRLMLASTEVASPFGGYLEGALVAARRAADQIQRRL